MSLALDALIFATAYAHVLLAPFTKVEESFNLHATHDVLMYGVKPPSLPNYDHFIFPGAVPRTFLGGIVLAWLTTPVLQLATLLKFTLAKSDLQIIVRLVLASMNAIGLCLLRRAVSNRFGRLTSLMYTLLTISQFHVPFYMGRTLPNMFALLPVNVASYLLINRNPNSLRPPRTSFNTAIFLLIFSIVVFRAELALFLGPLALQALVQGHTTFTNLIKIGLISGLFSIVITVCVDSYFWDQWPLWPEFSSIYFNVYEGKSSEWGTSPAHSYLTVYLPKLLLGSLPLSILGASLDVRIRSLLVPVLAFVGLISCLGHKEWRFVVYVVPIVNIGAARGAKWLLSRKKNTLFGCLAFLATVSIIAAQFAVTTLITQVSIMNYPGGEALATFNQKYAGQEHVHVHISNLAAQTGASLFQQTYSPPYLPELTPSTSSNWTYNKTESLTPSILTSSRHITHLIVESDSNVQSLVDSGQWKRIGSVNAFDGWDISGLRELMGYFTGNLNGALEDLGRFLPRPKMSAKLWIMERSL